MRLRLSWVLFAAFACSNQEAGLDDGGAQLGGSKDAGGDAERSASEDAHARSGTEERREVNAPPPDAGLVAALPERADATAPHLDAGTTPAGPPSATTPEPDETASDVNATHDADCCSMDAEGLDASLPVTSESATSPSTEEADEDDSATSPFDAAMPTTDDTTPIIGPSQPSEAGTVGHEWGLPTHCSYASTSSEGEAPLTCSGRATCPDFEIYTTCADVGGSWRCDSSRFEPASEQVREEEAYQTADVNNVEQACALSSALMAQGPIAQLAPTPPTCGTEYTADEESCSDATGCTYALEFASGVVHVWHATAREVICQSSNPTLGYCWCNEPNQGHFQQNQYFGMMDVPIADRCAFAKDLCEQSIQGTQPYGDGCRDTFVADLGYAFTTCERTVDAPNQGYAAFADHFEVNCQLSQGPYPSSCDCRTDADVAGTWTSGSATDDALAAGLKYCETIKDLPILDAPVCKDAGGKFQLGECSGDLECKAGTAVQEGSGSRTDKAKLQCRTSEVGWMCDCPAMFGAAAETFVVDPGTDRDAACQDVFTHCKEHIEAEGFSG